MPRVHHAVELLCIGVWDYYTCVVVMLSCRQAVVKGERGKKRQQLPAGERQWEQMKRGCERGVIRRVRHQRGEREVVVEKNTKYRTYLR